MGSNWRLNVDLIGWNNAGVELVAELRTPIPITFPPGAFVYYVGLRTGFTGRRRVLFTPGTELGNPGLGWVLIVDIPAVGAFPFGFDVFPD